MIDFLKFYINGYLIVDNFFSNDICEELRYKAHNSNTHKKYFDYFAIDYDIPDTESLSKFSDIIKSKISFLKNRKYLRSWSFIYDSVSRGVLPHMDPSKFNVNIWITPDKSVEDKTKNGIILYKKKPKKSLCMQKNDDYNRFVAEFLKDSKYDIIPYKYNRAVIFTGNTFHSTNSVHMKNGEENKRINYTFLYE